MSFAVIDPTTQAVDSLSQREDEAAAIFAILFALSPQFQRHLSDLTQTIEQRQASGKPVTPGWLVTQPEYRQLTKTIVADLNAVAPRVAARITDAQQFAADLGMQATTLSIDTQTPPTLHATQPPLTAVQSMVGRMGNGERIERYLRRELGQRAARLIREDLVRGLVAGQNPRVVAREISRQVPLVNRNRARLIARTEMLRAHRAAVQSTMRANSQLVRGWVWTAHYGPRTCMSCLIMDGTFHTLDEDFASHPGCRCSARPETKPWSELGFTDIPQPPRLQYETGREWFMDQPEAVQLRMMGPAKYAAWKGHRIGLGDLTATKRSRTWGVTRYEPSLKQVLRRRAT